MREVLASAPGKINLLLRVGQPQADGYHPLVTVFEAVNLRETVRVRTAKSPGIHIENRAYRADGSCDETAGARLDLLPPDQHLAGRAARIMQTLASGGPWGANASGVNIAIDKRVPVAGGMAGGSADAAATLVACNELWELGLSNDQLLAIGRTLGADIPACLMGGIALGTGRGDQMRSLRRGIHATSNAGTPQGLEASNYAPAEGQYHRWVLALSDRGLPTPEVFDELDVQGGPVGGWDDVSIEPANDILDALTESADIAASLMDNHLQYSALSLRPELAEVMEVARHAGALTALVSGSGPTVAALVDSQQAQNSVEDAWLRCSRVDSVLRVEGPSMGALVESLSIL